MNEGCTVTLGCIIIMLSVLHVRVDKHSMVVVMSHPSMLDTLFSSITNTCMHASCCCPASCLCGIKERLFVLLIMYGTSNCFVYLPSQEPPLLLIIVIVIILITCKYMYHLTPKVQNPGY